MEQNNKANTTFRFIIVPEFILSDLSLFPVEKLLFGDIVSLSYGKGYCWATNENLGKRYGVSDRTITRWVNRLVGKKLLIRELHYAENSRTIQKRRIKVNTNRPDLASYMAWYSHECHYPTDIDVQHPGDTNGSDNNISVNKIKLINLSPNLNSNTSLLSAEQFQTLEKEFGQDKLNKGINDYCEWKNKNAAHPRSDYDSLKKWLSKGKNQQSRRRSDVAATKVDEVSDESIAKLPF